MSRGQLRRIIKEEASRLMETPAGRSVSVADAINAVKEFAERNDLQFEAPYLDEEETEFDAMAFDSFGGAEAQAAFVLDGQLYFNSQTRGQVKISPAKLKTKTWEG